VVVSWLPLPRAEAYGASKAALDYLADTLRLDLASKGSRVTLIRPGFVQTPLTAKNDFPMPCLVTVAQASRAIMDGLTAGHHQIHFPRRFIWLLRLLGALPVRLPARNLTLAHGMRWLLRLPRWQQALFGVFGGASSYVAGAGLRRRRLWGGTQPLSM